MLSSTEENYLKCIFALSEKDDKGVTTNAIANRMQTSAASVTDMLRRLTEKQLLSYKKYKGVRLTLKGEEAAKVLVRKHRLWEVFLVETLAFSWDEVHEIAEQLEHIQSPLLIKRLDSFLGFPKFDPHGDPIPDAHGKFSERHDSPLSSFKAGTEAEVVGVLDHSTEFLQHLDQLNLSIGSKLVVKDIVAYDKSLSIEINGSQNVNISERVARNVLVKAS